jgi:hypothetical protein
MRLITTVLLALLFASASRAQVPPYVYAVTLGTTQVQVLPNNPSRHRVRFVNPNATALVAVCPSGPTRSSPSSPVAARINGPGCMTLTPYAEFVVDGGMSPGPVLYMPSPWVAIADTPASALTIWEFE